MAKRCPLLLIFLFVSTETLMAVPTGTGRRPFSSDGTRNNAPSHLPADRMQGPIGPVHIEGISAREAIDWWSSTTRIPVVIHWAQMESEGLDPENKINIRLRRAPGHIVLKLILRQFSQDTDLVVEPTPWYIEVVTKEQALRNSVVRVYDIGDLLHHVPNFGDVPSFDLQSALENTNNGSGTGRSNGGGKGNGSGLFGDSSRDDRERAEPEDSRAERAESLVRTMRETIEPDIWQAHGGQFASIRYYQRRLIVKAPPFVHRQIGLTKLRAGRPAHHRRQTSPAQRVYRAASPQSPIARRGVAGIRHSSRSRVSGVSR